VTDDTELAIAVADGVATCAGFSADGVAHQMNKWLLSQPFDLGNTTGRACARGGGGAGAMRAAASSDSLSNGSLMRCASLALLPGSNDEVMAVARAHATLTHARLEVSEAEACFLVAAGRLVQTCGDVGGAVEAASVCSQRCGEVVRTWVQEALDVNVPLPPCGPQDMGSVEHGLRRALRHLVRGSAFDAAIAEVIQEGYDTDTNAAIVGCMLGARDGVASLSRALWEPVLACDTRRGRPRPLCFHPARLPVLAERILSFAAETSGGTA
jgi:ADP-ribosylglycohydrolase